MYIIHHKNEENPATCDNMDGPWGHYAKWNKSDRERQIPYDLTYTQNVKHTHTHTHTHTNKLNDTENRLANWWLTEAEGYGISEDGQREELPVIIPRDIRYSVVTIVNNTVLHIWNFKNNFLKKGLRSHTSFGMRLHVNPQLCCVRWGARCQAS